MSLTCPGEAGLAEIWIGKLGQLHRSHWVKWHPPMNAVSRRGVVWTLKLKKKIGLGFVHDSSFLCVFSDIFYPPEELEVRNQEFCKYLSWCV